MAEQTDEIPLIDTELTVMALHNDADVETFAEQWNVSMSPNFLAVKDSKKHSIVSHSRRFRNKINLNHQPHELEALRKWIICIVDFGMNIGSEINGIRPALVYKSSKYKHWEDMVVIPITSFQGNTGEEKSRDTLDIQLDPDKSNGMEHTSLIKVRQIKCISKKRLRKDKNSGKIKILWRIVDLGVRKNISANVIEMLGLNELDEE